MAVPYHVTEEVEQLYADCSYNVQKCAGFPATHPLRAKVAEVNASNMEKILSLEAPYSESVEFSRDQFVGGKPGDGHVSSG